MKNSQVGKQIINNWKCGLRRMNELVCTEGKMTYVSLTQSLSLYARCKKVEYIFCCFFKMAVEMS